MIDDAWTERAWELAELAPLAAAVGNADATQWRISSAARGLFGMTGLSLGSLLSVLDDRSGTALTEMIRETVAGLDCGAEPLHLVLDSAKGRGRTIQADLAPMRPGGDISGWLLTFTDVTALARERDGLGLQLDDLRHRLRNIYTVVLGLIRLSRPRDADDAAVAAIVSRIQALAAAQDASDDPRGLSLELLATRVLEPFRADERFAVTRIGEDPLLAPGIATPLALALHELATNALKHGALAGDAGMVQLELEAVGAGCALRWTETGSVEKPGRDGGIGTRLLALTIEGQLGGQLKRHWTGSTLRIEISVPALADAKASARQTR